MEPIRTLHEHVLPLDRADVDTDQIIPKQFLKRIERTGYGDFLFFDWRQESDFVLNHPHHQGARILVAGKNFGSGSSREHAAWALNDYGIRCVIAPSFADIFASNASKNGLLLVVLSEDQVNHLLASASGRRHHLRVSLEEQTVSDDNGFHTTFVIDPFLKHRLLNGLDDIGLTLRHADQITRFEQSHDTEFWYAPRPILA